MKNDRATFSVWVELELTNVNYRYIFGSRNRNAAKMPHLVFSLEKKGRTIIGFSKYNPPYCKLFQIENDILDEYMIEGVDYFGYFSDFDFECHNENESIFAAQIVFVGEDDNSYISDKKRVENNNEILDKLGKQNLYDTKTASWICYEYEDDSENIKDRDCSLYRGNIQCNVVGVNKVANYKNIISKILANDTVLLKNEPDNEYDDHAIAVFWHNERIGYISRRDIPIVALCMKPEGIEAGVSYVEEDIIDIVLAPTLINLGDEYYNEEYGPFTARVKYVPKGSSAFACSVEIPCSITKYKEIFYYEGPVGNILKVR